MLTGTQSLVGKSIDSVHDWIRHRETADGATTAMHQDVRARAAERSIKPVGIADIDGTQMSPGGSKVCQIDGIEAFGRLLIALVLLWSQGSGPKADWVRGKKREAFVFAHPQLKLRLLFEYSDEQRMSGQDLESGF